MQRQRDKIAQRIVSARHAAKRSIEAAAKVAGVTRFKWMRFESGKTSIPSEILPRVAMAINENAANLLADVA